MSEVTISGEFRAACEREFAEIRVKLDRLDEAIRGNGKPGISLRLERQGMTSRTLEGRSSWPLKGYTPPLPLKVLRGLPWPVGAEGPASQCERRLLG